MRPISFLFLFLAVAWVAASCTGDAGRDPNEFRVGIESTPASLDPRYATDAHGVRIIPLIFNGLLRKTPEGGVEPDLAVSWETPAPLVHELVLREGVTFHDGSLLTAQDVVATYNYLRNPENGSPHSGALKSLASVVAEGDKVVFTLSEQYVSFPFQLTHGILPERLAQIKDIGDELTGTGPFRLARYLPGEEVLLTAFADHFRGAPKIDRARFRIVGSATTRLLEVRSGGLDLLQNAVPPYSLKFLERQEGLDVVRGAGSSYQYLGFNLKDPLTSDLRVRRAIAHALDRDALIRYVMQGQARKANSVFPPEHWAHAPGAMSYDYDPARAMVLLDEAGYTDPDGDGPLKRFSLSYKTSTDKTANEAARIIADQLGKVGIGVEVMSFEWGTFFGDVKKGNFQLMSLRWVGLSDPDVLHYIFHSESVPPNGANRGRYLNPELDRWLDGSRGEADMEKRAALYRSIQEKIAEDCVYASLWWPDNVVVLSERFTGYRPLPGGEYVSLAEVEPAGKVE